jgi:hypothetical protein
MDHRDKPGGDDQDRKLDKTKRHADLILSLSREEGEHASREHPHTPR